LTQSDFESEAREHERHIHWSSMLAIRESSIGRSIYEVFVAILLLYVGTVFMFRLCFLDFHQPEAIHPGPALTAISTGIDYAFYIDLVVYFFFTYRDHYGREVTDLRKIAKRYVSTHFLINVVACLPPEIGVLLMPQDIKDGDSTTANEAVRLLRLQRLQRLSRLFRLARLGRLAKLVNLKNTPFMQYLQGFRSVRIINFGVSLFFAVHLLACGWYLVASLHSNVNQTWLSRRTTDVEGNRTLLDDHGPFLQWLHAMYFVMTVFTTVGFGDMYALTTAEMIYVIMLFFCGRRGA
jgi:hypothetical protein